ncbi:MAG: 3-oxoacyl-ACP synthase [Allomuricauda sp.]
MNKKGLWQHCLAQVEERALRFQKEMEGLQEALTSETKNTTGDKHETGRAMVQLEQEKLSLQMQELEKAKQTLKRINIGSNTVKIGLGSLVQTNMAHYFIAISAGAYTQEGNTVYCISAGSPIAQLLIGKEKGENFVFNGKVQTILGVQ